MGKRLTTAAELRRGFPSVSHWWVKLQLALRRDGSVAIVVRDADLELAIRQKLWPGLYPDVRPGQVGKAAATIALRDAIRPRRTGTPRPRRYRDREITSVIHAVVSDRPDQIAAVIDRARAEHHRRSLTPAEHLALLQDVRVCRNRTDLRAVLAPWLKRQ